MEVEAIEAESKKEETIEAEAGERKHWKFGSNTVEVMEVDVMQKELLEMEVRKAEAMEEEKMEAELMEAEAMGTQMKEKEEDTRSCHVARNIGCE